MQHAKKVDPSLLQRSCGLLVVQEAIRASKAQTQGTRASEKLVRHVSAEPRRCGIHKNWVFTFKSEAQVIYIQDFFCPLPLQAGFNLGHPRGRCAALLSTPQKGGSSEERAASPKKWRQEMQSQTSEANYNHPRIESKP